MPVSQLIIFHLILAFAIDSTYSTEACGPDLVDYNKGKAVRCNATYCDRIAVCKKLDCGTVYIYVTSESGYRFRLMKSRYENPPLLLAGTDYFVVDSSVKYQTFIGIGGAITDAAALTIACLSPCARKNLIRSYFSHWGIEYNFVRVTIAGTDFSCRPYTYDDNCNVTDEKLCNFRLTREDYQFKIPLIKIAKAMSSRDIKLLASAWNCPRWMKTVKEIAQSPVDPKYYDAWACYHVKFLNAYKCHNITFYAITTGNEPTTQLVSMSWPVPLHLKYCRDHLIPKLKRCCHENIKIYMMDDQTPFLPLWASQFNDPEMNKYIEGLATHWYLDIIKEIILLQKGIHALYPNKSLISSEATFMNSISFETAWEKAEKYAEDIMARIVSWGRGWIDWNIALDLQGGPNHLKNYCDAPIRIDCARDEFFKQAMFYILGHFSKFLPYGSARISINPNNNIDGTLSTQISAVAFQTWETESRIVVIILNRDSKDHKVIICGLPRGCTTVNVIAKSIATIVVSYAC